MSVRVMSQVWATSAQKGSALLVLLAIADNANDEGVAWPSVDTIAEKSRMSKRQVLRIVRDIESSGELEITTQRRGRSTHNVYQVVTDSQGQLVTVKPEPTVTKPAVHGDIAVAPEPPENLSEPNGSAHLLVAEFIDQARDRGSPPTKSVIGQVAQNTKKLLVEGVPPERIRQAYARMLDRGVIVPAMLPNFAVEAGLQERGPPPKRKTGWRQVRGTHGSTYVEDPNGTDYPGKGS